MIECICFLQQIGRLSIFTAAAISSAERVSCQFLKECSPLNHCRCPFASYNNRTLIDSLFSSLLILIFTKAGIPKRPDIQLFRNGRRVGYCSRGHLPLLLGGSRSRITVSKLYRGIGKYRNLQLYRVVQLIGEKAAKCRILVGEPDRASRARVASREPSWKGSRLNLEKATGLSLQERSRWGCWLDIISSTLPEGLGQVTRRGGERCHIGLNLGLEA